MIEKGFWLWDSNLSWDSNLQKYSTIILLHNTKLQERKQNSTIQEPITSWNKRDSWEVNPIDQRFPTCGTRTPRGTWEVSRGTPDIFHFLNCPSISSFFSAKTLLKVHKLNYKFFWNELLLKKTFIWILYKVHSLNSLGYANLNYSVWGYVTHKRLGTAAINVFLMRL